jgi:general secretion pathway protein C
LASDGTHSVPYKVLPLLTAGLASVYLIFSLIAIPQSGEEAKPIRPSANPESHALQTQQDFSSISGFHLFGHPVTSSSVGLSAESTQALQLKGVLYLKDNQAHAIIESAGHIQKTYRVNDTLPGGAVLQAIADHSIILTTNNGQESLSLDKTKLGLATATDMQPEPQPSNEQQPSADDIVIQPPESLAN